MMNNNNISFDNNVSNDINNVLELIDTITPLKSLPRSDDLTCSIIQLNNKSVREESKHEKKYLVLNSNQTDIITKFSKYFYLKKPPNYFVLRNIQLTDSNESIYIQNNIIYYGTFKKISFNNFINC